MTLEIRQFFDRFVQDFTRFDGALIASRYLAPYMAIHVDGSARVFDAPADIGAYFQGVLDDYRRLGCTRCRHGDLQVQPLGARAALASVTWWLDKADGGVASSWRESYCLVRVEGGWKVRSSVDHAA